MPTKHELAAQSMPKAAQRAEQRKASPSLPEPMAVPIKTSTAASAPEVDGAPESACVRGTTNIATSAAETSNEVMSIGQVRPSPPQWARRRLALCLARS